MSDGPSVEELVAAVSLAAITTTQLSAERFLAAQSVEEMEIEPQYSLVTEPRDDQHGFRVRLLTEIYLPIGTIRCGVAAEYEHESLEADSIPMESMQAFINGVAIMHILPFVRQGIADITMRVFENPLLMPIVQRGELNFNLESAQSSD